MKPAAVTPKGKFNLGLGISGGASKSLGIYEETATDWSVFFIPGLYVRYGIVKNAELGFEVLGGRTHLEGRYQFSNYPLVSVGFGVGLFSSYLGLYLGSKLEGISPYASYRFHMGHFGLGTYHTFAGGVHLLYKQPVSFILELSYSPSMAIRGEEELISGFSASAGINFQP
jgi:hypothetical protein